MIKDFQIVVLSPEKDIPNELEILHQLFEEGLEYYHFRKPQKNLKEHADYLSKIDQKFHSRIVTHLYHELLNDFDLKGIHFQEQQRRDKLEKGQTLNDYLSELSISKKELTISSSFHEPEELEKCDIDFDYHFLSPVFSSISKQGYEGKGFDVNHISKKVIGMGGVTSENLKEFNRLGFKGVGVLGGIWAHESPIQSFKEINGN